MDPKGQALLKLLFNPGEEICVSNSQWAYRSIPLEAAFDSNIELVSPNTKVPVSSCDSSEILLCAVNPITGFRCDKNVQKFRSYLIEIDTGSLKDQIRYLKHLKMPFSAQVFSGNKSIHTVITLDEDLKNEKEYRAIGDWIFQIVKDADKNCRNPSRCIRVPGAYREENKKQRLMNINARISHKELFAWLKQYEHLRPKAKQKRIIIQGHEDYSRLSPWCRWMLKNGIDFKNGRNQTWYAIAYDFALAGFNLDKTVDLLQNRFIEESDFKEKEFLTAINSAFKTVEENK